MVAAIVFVIGFVVVAFGVLFVALHARARRRRPEHEAPTGLPWAATVGLTALICLASLGGAIAIGVGNADVRAKNGGPGGAKLSASELHGRELFTATCAACHTLATTNSVGKVGPNLDQLRPPKALVLATIANGVQGDTGRMPAGLYVGVDATDIAKFVAAVAGR